MRSNSPTGGSGAGVAADDPYAAAVHHYASARRSDLVKTLWERPVLVRLVGRALRHLRGEPGNSGAALHALDVGAGAGEGFDLIAAAALAVGHPSTFRYTALDRSDVMLRLAVTRLEKRAELIKPVVGDMADHRYTDDPAQLYLSSGAPYSELTVAQLTTAVRRICAAISCSRQSAALILDVYGRYCPAWLPVSAPRWLYSMNFFYDTEWPPTREMGFYTPGQLDCILAAALTEELRGRLTEVTFVDRSVFAGRHTTTCAYNPQLPRIRTIVNAVLAGDTAAVPALRVPSEAVLETPAFRSLDEQAAQTLSARIDSWNELVRCGPTGSLTTRLHALNDSIGAAAIGGGHYLTMLALFAAG